MDELINYNGYEEFKQAVNRVLNRTVEDFVLTGYLLKQARDTDILKDSGYNDVNEFAWGEYKLDASQVSRYIRVNRTSYELDRPQSRVHMNVSDGKW